MNGVSIKNAPFSKLISAEDYFYSKSLQLYVAIKPLRVDERVVNAADKASITLNWDEEGKVNTITFDEARKLLACLGSSMLSLKEYWAVYKDAVAENRQDVVKSLESSEFTEFLDVILFRDASGRVTAIEHAELKDSSDKISYEGIKVPMEIPDARPGWFIPQGNIDDKTGLPVRLEHNRNKLSESACGRPWKFWSVFKQNEPVFPIRGYVLSSASPSIDMDIPVCAKQPVLVVRECRKELVDKNMDRDFLNHVAAFTNQYLDTLALQPGFNNKEPIDDFYRLKNSLLSFLQRVDANTLAGNSKDITKAREKIIDILGLFKIISLDRNDQEQVDGIDKLSHALLGITNPFVSYEDLKYFIQGSSERLKAGLEQNRRIVFVMGHENPDTDTAISAVFEAFRNSLLDRESEYIPVIQGRYIPDEIERLLGRELAEGILLSSSDEYRLVKDSGQARWILVDQNTSKVQKFVLSIIDHHTLSGQTMNMDIPITWEMMGSSTALIVQKLLGMGLTFDTKLARLLLGACLMDTEDRSAHKMTYKDSLIMDYLEDACGIQDVKAFYQELMSCLLNSDNAELIFNRDYKQDWGIFGYSVAKVKFAFDEKGELQKTGLADKLVSMAKENNKAKNFPLTIIKLVDYCEDNETVNRERVYFIFNQYVLPEFRRAVFELIDKIVEYEFEGKAHTKQSEEYFEFWGVGTQLSRKVSAPAFEPLVSAFNEYFYSPSNHFYIRREFLKLNQDVQHAADKSAIQLQADSNGRVNMISFHDAKLLLSDMGMFFMSLKEYWLALKDAQAANDTQMVRHLKSSDFIELLDTVILQHDHIIDHPQTVENGPDSQYSGESRKVTLIEAVPALISEEDIDPETGLPGRIQDPNQYGMPGLWRYWSPDADQCVATRGHIFLLNQPALDTKVHPDDRFPNLGVRPCCYRVDVPKVEILCDESNGVYVRVIK